MTDSNLPPRRDPYSALRFTSFRLLLLGNFITSFGSQMLTMAVGWELWLRTHSTMILGMVGLVQVVPVILLSLVGGHIADIYNRKRIVLFSQGLLALCSLALGLLSFYQGPIPLIFAALLGIGIARAFNSPAASTLLPQTIPSEHFTNAATWSSSAWQVASIFGPTAAGLIAAALNSVTIIYFFDVLAALVYIVLIHFIDVKQTSAHNPQSDAIKSLAEGLTFIKSSKVLLAAITLDMFAVLFGGAVTLLPVYATDILKIGPQGLGIMRAAPSIGSIVIAFILSHTHEFKSAGKTLLWAVAGFGAATIIFGISTNYWLSLAMLFILGGLDNISVVIRGALLLIRTPDHLRGRVSAVNSIFIGVSNEMGGFESGLAASLLGTVPSVAFGGFMTILVVLLVSKILPEILQMTTLHDA